AGVRTRAHSDSAPDCAARPPERGPLAHAERIGAAHAVCHLFGAGARAHPDDPRGGHAMIARVALAAVVSLAFAQTARADPPPVAEADPARAAEALASEAYAQHLAGRDAEAIGTYLKAYELSHAAAILFNVAMIYDRKLHERALAMDYFR